MTQITATASSSSITATASASTVAAAVSSSTVSASAGGGIGPQGPQGQAGNAGDLGDLLDVQISSVAAGDVLRFSSNKWRNSPESNLTDGGNY